MSIALIEQYINYVEKEKDLSPNTVDAYTKDLEQLNIYFQENNIDSMIHINKTNIITYLIYLQRCGKTNTTISRKLTSIRCFYQYLLNNGMIKEDPTFNLKSPKKERKSITILTIEELDILLSQPDTRCYKGCRDRAMLELICSTGLRVSEMLSLNIRDFDFKSSVINLNDNRIILVEESASIYISKYLNEFRINYNIDDPLFTNLYGNRLTRQGFWKIMKAYAKYAGFNKTVTPQVLRNSFAFHIINNGINIYKAKDILGHSNITTTERYLLK
ncbi:tyrosine-type recombinase/integrase [Wansuia hejianensis]|uniref:Tyrosine-type recombinase/integrase n=1 Tax=Wansuia hejianensis TaxID=2763667 RepID=A0A926F278_9FIRM|nr:tyrosine-type recombinase/integrase [Wansuia hejianensis]MBC8590559.1 tyrosine-type recombinase/integrase [Wansuia hejianensis]